MKKISHYFLFLLRRKSYQLLVGYIRGSLSYGAMVGLLLSVVSNVSANDIHHPNLTTFPIKTLYFDVGGRTVSVPTYSSISQNSISQNAYSLNFEYFIKNDLPVRVGFGLVSGRAVIEGYIESEVNVGRYADTFLNRVNDIVITLPITLSKLIPITLFKLPGDRKHKLELGGGAVFWWMNRDLLIGDSIDEYDSVVEKFYKLSGAGFSLSGIIGYRYESPKKWFLRLSYTPFLRRTYHTMKGWHPSQTLLTRLGVGVGYTFK